MCEVRRAERMERIAGKSPYVCVHKNFPKKRSMRSALRICTQSHEPVTESSGGRSPDFTFLASRNDADPDHQEDP